MGLKIIGSLWMSLSSSSTKPMAIVAKTRAELDANHSNHKDIYCRAEINRTTVHI